MRSAPERYYRFSIVIEIRTSIKEFKRGEPLGGLQVNANIGNIGSVAPGQSRQV